jgi:hypothetical protein
MPSISMTRTPESGPVGTEAFRKSTGESPSSSITGVHNSHSAVIFLARLLVWYVIWRQSYSAELSVSRLAPSRNSAITVDRSSDAHEYSKTYDGSRRRTHLYCYWGRPPACRRRGADAHPRTVPDSESPSLWTRQAPPRRRLSPVTCTNLAHVPRSCPSARRVGTRSTWKSSSPSTRSSAFAPPGGSLRSGLDVA